MSIETELSVVIPTRNRPAPLSRLLHDLQAQAVDRCRVEILVVDDDSQPPVMLDSNAGEQLRLVRRAHGERSTARNYGATEARGGVLLFLDDDLRLGADLVAAHLAAQREWPGCLVVGAIQLPADVIHTPFGAFRHGLETAAVPRVRGLVASTTFCAAGNMSIARARFLELGGFDPEIVSAEDQDFALRHSAAGGRIVYLPEALAIHDDENVDIRSYCRRTEWGAEHLLPFCRRYPDLPDNVDRARANRSPRWGDPAALLLKKIGKDVLGLHRLTETVFVTTALLERWRPASSALPRLYRLLLGIHLQRGFRRGWSRTDTASPTRVER